MLGEMQQKKTSLAGINEGKIGFLPPLANVLNRNFPWLKKLCVSYSVKKYWSKMVFSFLPLLPLKILQDQGVFSCQTKRPVIMDLATNISFLFYFRNEKQWNQFWRLIFLVRPHSMLSSLLLKEHFFASMD